MSRAGSGLSRQALLLASARASGQLIMVAIQAVVARQIGVERFGVFASAFAMATVLSGLIDFGAGSYWVREFSAGRLSSAEFGRRSSGKICVGALVALVLLSAGILGLPFRLLALAAGVLIASVVSQTFQVMLIAAQKNTKLSTYALLERLVLGAVFSLLTWLSPLAPEFTFVVSYICASFTFAGLTSATVPQLLPNFREIAWQRTWAGARYYGLSTCLISLQSTDVLIGGAVGGPGVAGAYGAVSKWTMPITLATQSFSSLLNPIVSAAQDRHDVWRRMRKSVWLPAISVLAAVTMAVFAEPLVLFVLGRQFIESVGIMRLMALAAALSSIAQVAFTVLQARRRERVVALGLAVAVSTQLMLVAPLVQHFGALGLAVAAIAAQSVLCLVLGASLIGVLRTRG